LGEDILLEETVGFTEMCSFFVEGVNADGFKLSSLRHYGLFRLAID
jgi:hypothetical protein